MLVLSDIFKFAQASMTNMVERGGKAIAAWQRVCHAAIAIEIEVYNYALSFCFAHHWFYVALLLTCVYLMYVFFGMQDLFVWFINDSFV